ncbi:MAG: hypothetical protein WD598_06165 [Acidimicrobiia bacterium]
MDAVRTALLAVGYPVSLVVIARWLPVVRERRTKWFVAHEAAVAAIVAGWAIDDNRRAVSVNGTWLVVAAAWYALGGRRPTRA